MLAVLAEPAVASAAEFDVAAATNQSGLDLHRRLAADRAEGNLVISPYSIESALALVFAGAAGDTRAELERALRFPADETSVQSAFARLRTNLDQLTQEPAGSAGESGRQIEWHAANRLFGQKGYAFLDPFLTRMRDGYAAPFEPLDFRGNPEQARLAINAWVEEQTRQKIRHLIPPGGVDARTRLALVNALYWKAQWETPFKTRLTHARPFHASASASHDVRMMRRTDFLRYAREDGFVVVALDYTAGLQFLILLPDEGTSPAALEAKLTADHFARWAKLDKKANVDLWLPKFRIEGATLALGPALRALGVRSAFDEPRGSANFERIAPRRPDDTLALAEVFHQTFIAVDETGTEAAAATGGMVLTTFAVTQEEAIAVHVDRPFLFAIQHRASGTCLFLGRISDPR